MKHSILKWLVAVTMAVALAGQAAAKNVVQPRGYMFGFAASFNDTIVHFTDVQAVDSVWIDSKTKFLLGREQYALQLRDYLKSNKQLPHRTCIVVYHADRAKLEKKFIKMRKLYATAKEGKQHFDVNYLNSGEFKFQVVYMPEPDEEETEEERGK